MKALDIYLAVCFFMVFGALLEYATVSYVGKRIKLNIKRFEEFEKQLKDLRSRMVSSVYIQASDHADTCPVKIQHLQSLDHESLQLDNQDSGGSKPTTLYGWKPSDVERWARFLFPLFFVTFHFFYWTTLINISDATIDGLMPLKKKVGY